MPRSSPPNSDGRVFIPWQRNPMLMMDYCCYLRATVCPIASSWITPRSRHWARAKAREADCWIKQTKAYSPWSNFANLAIRELKKGCARKMIRAKVPKRLWDECLEMESYICSNTYNGHSSLKGETPETVMSGEAADISEFAEHAFYDWIKFQDTTVAFSGRKLVLGRYLGPSTNIGPAMTTKILKQTGHVIHRSTFRALTGNEMQDPAETQSRAEFDSDIDRIFGDVSLAEAFGVDFTAEEVQDLYSDNSQDNNGVPDQDNLPDNHYDQYVNAEVLLPKGDSMVRGKVKRRKLDNLGIPTGRRHDNPIVDTRTYYVEFPDGAEMEYTANMIAESMWAQCNIDGNQWLLMEAIIDHRANDSAVKEVDGYVAVNNRLVLSVEGPSKQLLQGQSSGGSTVQCCPIGCTVQKCTSN
jgi:hypothetical protein